jgi:hypothetical protein
VPCLCQTRPCPRSSSATAPCRSPQPRKKIITFQRLIGRMMLFFKARKKKHARFV